MLTWLLLACTGSTPSETAVPTESDEEETDTTIEVDVEAVEALYQDLLIPTLPWVESSLTRGWMEQVVHAAQRVCGLEEDMEAASDQTLHCSEGEESSVGYVIVEWNENDMEGGMTQNSRYDEVFLRVQEEGVGFWYSNGRLRYYETVEDGEIQELNYFAQVDVELPAEGEPLWEEGDLDQTIEVAWSRRNPNLLVMDGHLGGPASLGFTGLLVEDLRLYEDPECPEPEGVVGLRDVDGTWFYAEFAGPHLTQEDTGTVMDVTPENCDGCGTLYRRTVEVGEICLDFTPWMEVTW